ncbi:MAG: UvrD-helicase domain-containing protein, partial [Acetobacteraceae bacterium]
TSPIQLALFTAMASLVGHSAWVGDPKQAIYGFRNADPELMNAVVREIPDRTGGTVHRLETSRRSRPGLVRFFDDLFVPAFAALGMERTQVALEQASRVDAPEQPEPLAVLPLPARNEGQETEALARGIVAMLRQPEAWPVVPKGHAAFRPLRAGDIAPMCSRFASTCRFQA